MFSIEPFVSYSCAAVWIGHSTVLFKIEDKTFITDPIFSKRIFILPRLRPPAMEVEQLPRIDHVLVSHTHFDHMDRPSLKRIAAHSPGAVLALPKGGQVYLGEIPFGRVDEHDLWEDRQTGGVTITRVPSRHFGGRWGPDQLWKKTYGGFVVRYKERSVYFAGDTGYQRDIFQKIGRLAKPDLALLPIGAYSPPPIRNHHMNPEDALNAMSDLGAKAMLPIHHSTFILSMEPVREPIRLLRSLASRNGARVHFVRRGEVVSFATGTDSRGGFDKSDLDV